MLVNVPSDFVAQSRFSCVFKSVHENTYIFLFALRTQVMRAATAKIVVRAVSVSLGQPATVRARDQHRGE
jgi:hypothetical protein